MSDTPEDARPDIVVTMSKPPSTNKLWSRGAGGRRVQSPEYKAWLTTAGWEVKRQIVGLKPLDCRYNLTIEVPISRRDTDNWAKPISDLCQHVGVVTNDGNVNRITITPVDRADCMAAFWSLPEMGNVRKAARPGYVGRAWKPKNKPGLTWKI